MRNDVKVTYVRNLTQAVYTPNVIMTFELNADIRPSCLTFT